MTTITRRHRRPDRHAHQQAVAALLDQLEERRRRLYLLETAGVRPAALHDLKTELHELHRALATAVADRTTTLAACRDRAAAAPVGAQQVDPICTDEWVDVRRGSSFWPALLLDRC